MDERLPTEPPQGPGPGAVVGAQYCLQNAEQFTLENSLTTKDWSITDASGQEVFRVHGKQAEWFKSRRELVDMDGNTIVIMKQKQLSSSWHSTWTAFDPRDQEQPLWTMRKSSGWSTEPRLQMFLPSNKERGIPDYTLTGEWRCTKCTIFFGEQKVAAVVRETPSKSVFASKRIYRVQVQPGVDTAFVFSVIVIMDKLYLRSKANMGASKGAVFL